MGAISNHKYITQAGWAHAPHLDEEEKQAMREVTPKHLLPAREFGEPTSSVGRIYPWDFSTIAIDPIRLHPSWPRVYGFDPAVNRTAALWAALDEHNDVLYLYGEYFSTHQITRLHAETINTRGTWIPGVFDPAAEGKILDGRKMIDVYRSVGLKNLHLADNAVRAGLDAVTDRVMTGRLKAFSTLGYLRFEWNNYLRDKNQKIIKERDDLLDCLRYVCLSGIAIASVNPEWVGMMTARGGGSTSGIADTAAGF